MRERDLTSDEQVQALAAKAAVQAAGGLEVCARETGKSTSQLSRCCSRDHADSLSVRDAAIIDAIRIAPAAPPHILVAQARIAGFVVVPLPSAPSDPSDLLRTVAEMMGELGDVSREIGVALNDDSRCDPAEADRILKQLDEHDQVSARLRQKLVAIREDSK